MRGQGQGETLWLEYHSDSGIRKGTIIKAAFSMAVQLFRGKDINIQVLLKTHISIKKKHVTKVN